MPAFDRTELYRRFYYLSDIFRNPSVPKQYPPDLELEPIHIEIDLYVDVAKKTAGGIVTTTVRARQNGPSELKLHAVDFLDVVVSDADGQAISHQYDGHRLVINWGDPFSAGEERRVEVSYHVIEPVDGLFFSKPDDAYPDQAWYAATDHETERARHWLPCIDLPSVRTTLDLRLQAEERFTILANGYLSSEKSNGDGTKTAHWKLEQLCPSYLICFAIGEFIRADDSSFDNDDSQVPLAYFCSLEHDAESLLRAFGRTGPMMSWMTSRLDMPFPFPKYYQFALPLMGGAMENISLVSWSDNFVLDEATADELSWLVDMINVHEMAHSYFGDAVVIRDFAHAWLKESWATYMEQCWCEDNTSEDEAQYVYYDNAVRYFREADERYKRPIVTRRFKSSWQIYDAHLYPGGACRLHTLRHELGDQVFWAAVHDYLKRYYGKVVETDDFRLVMEAHSGRSLGQFFDQWFHSPGYPDLKVSFNYNAKHKQGTFEIEQKQVDQEDDVPVFVFSTEIGWTTKGQEHRQRIHIQEAKQSVVVSMAAEPEQVRFDPAYKFLHKLALNPGDPMLKRQLVEAQDAIGRILAANELAKTGKRANIHAIVEAYLEEPFWGARERFVMALGEAGTQAAIEGLVKIICFEQDPLVLPVVFRTAAEFRDPGIQAAIGERLVGELNPVARQKAYEAMGAQRIAAQWDVLMDGSQQSGFNGIAQSGAFRGLAATRRAEALDMLLDQVTYGNHSNRVRPAIVSALADIGRGLEKQKREQVIEKMTDLLRDPWLKVSWQAVFGLSSMNAPEAIPALEAYGREQSVQIRVYIEDLIDRLRKADKSDGSVVKKQVEDLRDKVRKLEDQLQKLEARVDG